MYFIMMNEKPTLGILFVSIKLVGKKHGGLKE